MPSLSSLKYFPRFVIHLHIFNQDHVWFLHRCSPRRSLDASPRGSRPFWILPPINTTWWVVTDTLSSHTNCHVHDGPNYGCHSLILGKRLPNDKTVDDYTCYKELHQRKLVITPRHHPTIIFTSPDARCLS